MKVRKLICFHILHENLFSVYLFVLMEEEREAHTRQLLSSGKVWKPQLQASAKISVCLYKVETEKTWWLQ